MQKNTLLQKTLFTIILLYYPTYSQTTPNPDTNTCIVDRCTSCPSVTSPICYNCKSGYYVRNFDGNHTVSQCWSSLSLWLYVLFSIITIVVSVLACYGCFYLGKSGILENLRNTQMEPKEFPEPLFLEEFNEMFKSAKVNKTKENIVSAKVTEHFIGSF